MTKALIQLKGLSFSYAGETTLADIDLTVEESDFVAIIGPSGCGKSTLLRLVSGLLMPTSGQVLVGGRPVSGPGLDRAMVFQDYSLFPWSTCAENIVLALEQARPDLGARKRRSTAEEYLAEGAVDVLAFGPWLIRDGELNTEALDKYGKSSAQRVAVGMVEKGHYFFMMLEGRIQRSKGDGIRFLAEKLLDKGCTVGFNLDGGDTSCIVFMGRQLCKNQNGKKNKPSRRTSDILGIGKSDLLPAISDPF